MAAKGNQILVSTCNYGRRMEGIIAAGETPSPGAILQIDPTVALVGGRNTFKLYNRDADGDRPIGPHWVLLDDPLQGRLPTTAYAAGDRCFVYAPLPGDELNLLISNVAGTATITAGTLLIVDDTTGELIVTTGTVEAEVAITMEDAVDVAADFLSWCMWTGH